MTNVLQDAYKAARVGVAFARLDYGWLRLAGRDRLALLHRLSTNDLRALPSGSGRPTILTTPTARILALLFVYASADAVYLRTAPGQAAMVRRYIDSMIFFQDDVTVTDTSHEVAHFGFYGPQSAALLLTRVGVGSEVLPREPYASAQASPDESAWLLQRGGPLDLADYTLTVPQERGAALEANLTAAAPALDAHTLDVLRIETGLPAWGYELSDQTTPLETGLNEAISYTKGCYTGQEVIARQTNYDKVTRLLAGLRLPPGSDVAALPGAPIRAGGGRGGFVGSVAYSPTLDETIALAVLPRDLTQPGTLVTIERGEQEVTATVTTLPFVQRSHQTS